MAQADDCGCVLLASIAWRRFRRRMLCEEQVVYKKAEEGL
jgi:hypothetical protein